MTAYGSVAPAFAPKQNRWDEPLKFLPVAYILGNIVLLYGIYLRCHVMQMRIHLDPDAEPRAYNQFWLFNFFVWMMVICYVRVVTTHPGTVPDGWDTVDAVKSDRSRRQELEEVRARLQAAPVGSRQRAQLRVEHDRLEAAWAEEATPCDLRESKRNGDRRQCKWCQTYKPDRCHHCRICRTCVLRMDHHCPWIYNCVGLNNHKFFFLLLFYSTITIHFLFWTMLETTLASLGPATPFLRMFFVLFGQTHSGLLCFALTLFFIFHVVLMCRNMTTLEFCEKHTRRAHLTGANYDKGWYKNLQGVLGESPLFWLVPWDTVQHDGLQGLERVSKSAPELMDGAKPVHRPHPYMSSKPSPTGSPR